MDRRCNEGRGVTFLPIAVSVISLFFFFGSTRELKFSETNIDLKLERYTEQYFRPEHTNVVDAGSVVWCKICACRHYPV